MTRTEATRLRLLINFHKLRWRVIATEAAQQPVGRRVFYRQEARLQEAEAIRVIIHYFHLKLPVDMVELPEHIDLRKYVRKPGETIREWEQPV